MDDLTAASGRRDEEQRQAGSADVGEAFELPEGSDADAPTGADEPTGVAEPAGAPAAEPMAAGAAAMDGPSDASAPTDAGAPAADGPGDASAPPTDIASSGDAGADGFDLGGCSIDLSLFTIVGLLIILLERLYRARELDR